MQNSGQTSIKERMNEYAYQKAVANLREHLFGELPLSTKSLIKNLTIFAQQQMEKDYDVNLLDTKIDIDNSCTKFTLGHTDGKEITLHPNIFTIDEKLINDIDTVFHELRHVAQYVNKPKDGIDLEFIKYRFFDSILQAFTASIEKDKRKVLFIRKYRNFLHGLYARNEWEIDARGFALDATHNLLELCSTNLPQEKQALYDYYRNQLQKIINKEESNILYTQASELYSPQDFIKDTNYIIKKIKSGDPIKWFLAEAYSENPCNERLKEQSFVADGLIECLAFSYDDKIARKIYNTIICSNVDYSIKLNFINELFIKTDFALTDDDLNDLNKMCKIVSGYPLEKAIKAKQIFKKSIEDTFKINSNGQITEE